jgi:hypothetical protein
VNPASTLLRKIVAPFVTIHARTGFVLRHSIVNRNANIAADNFDNIGELRATLTPECVRAL